MPQINLTPVFRLYGAKAGYHYDIKKVNQLIDGDMVYRKEWQ